MDREPSSRRVLLAWIVGSLAAWGALLALGTFLGIDPATPDYDIRRMLVVVGVFGTFLALWGVLLWRRGRP
ncbi:MAG TPA: hypothetical protein VEQ85_05255 [Lacipirellulaceae bacterium]|nr:hypothetical protein [Lacipirellulaceae bacterium]